jgi:N6-adenosine-specific RNA methylase IME4
VRTVKYRTIVADPPWAYEHFQPSQWAGREWRPEKPYPSMSVDEIAALRVADLAAADARLFLWTTNRYLPDAFTVLAAWGFRYRQAVTWRKTGNVSPFPGHIAPQHSEHLLVAARGNPGRMGLFPSSVIDGPKPAVAGGHSRKPDVFADLIETASPGPYLEMFARQQRLGWDTWGNEALEHVEIAS